MGSVVTFLDRHQRTVFGTITELQRATKPSSPAARSADGACPTPCSGSSRPAPPAERRCSRSSSRSASCCRVADGRAAHRPHGEALQHRHAQPEALDGGVSQRVPPCAETAGESRPTAHGAPRASAGESTPTGKATDRGNAGADLPRLLRIRTEMIDPTATGTVKRPSANLRRPPGRKAISAPPAPVDETTRGASPRSAARLATSRVATSPPTTPFVIRARR